ncbi:MAG: hypothetical protein AAB683_01945, partial [Patescibacteria group bacterium]
EIPESQSLPSKTPIIDSLRDESIVENINKVKLNIIKNPEIVETPKTTNLKSDFNGQRSIRTYESDMAYALSKKTTSVAKIVIAENMRSAENESRSNNSQTNTGKNVLKISISLIFILAGLAGGYYLYLKSPLAKQTVVKQENKIPSVITPDEQRIVSSSIQNKSIFTSFLSSQFNRSDTGTEKIIEIIPTIKTSASTTVKVNALQVLKVLEFDITDTLRRSITNHWMMGVYSNNGQSIPFIILTNNFFQNAYAGMLKWEDTMPDEFIDIFAYKDKAYRNNQNGTSTISNYFNIKGKFEDKIIKNRDIREFITENGEILIIYSFLDKNTIVITTSESVIPALVERIEKQAYIR